MTSWPPNQRLRSGLISLFVVLFIGFGSLPLHGSDLSGKYHPGHYVALNEAEAVSSIKELDEPAVRGVNKRYFWAELEPERGIYNF